MSTRVHICCKKEILAAENGEARLCYIGDRRPYAFDWAWHVAGELLQSSCHSAANSTHFAQTTNPDEVIQAVEAAIECGYRHIDTAFNYSNEKDIGKALQKLFTAGKVKREDLFIVTKVARRKSSYYRSYTLISLSS